MDTPTLLTQKNEKKYIWIIGILSVLIPLVVAILLYLPENFRPQGLNTKLLPHINAVLNSLTSSLLIIGFIFIKNKNIRMHRAMMSSAFVLSSIFLVSYVIYHFSPDSSVRFGDVNHDKIVDDAEKLAVGGIRYLYLFILLTHIILAGIVVPLVLFAFYFALSNQIPRHKKIVKWTYPIWLYVAITGVVVYLMIKPYYF
jgi:putative membrane protein